MMRSSRTVMPPRPSRGLTRGAPSSTPLTGGDIWATALASSGVALAGGVKLATGILGGQPVARLNLVRDFKVCTINVRTMNELGAAALLDRELTRMGVGLAGLQEVRWPGVRETSEGSTRFLWSGSASNERKNGVALAMSPQCASALLSWQPVNDRILLARFRHIHGTLSVVVA